MKSPATLLVMTLLTLVFAPALAGDRKERIDDGVRLHDQGDFDGAIAIYRSVLSDHPHDPTAVYEWKKASDTAFFSHALGSIVAMFCETDIIRDGPFWVLVLPWFAEAKQTGHIEALSYTLSRSAGDEPALAWIEAHAAQALGFECWN